MTDAAGAERWVPEGGGIADLREAVRACRGCELYRDATQAVLGRGPDGAELMVVGEQPGDQEDRQGEPFVGPAGKLLDKALEDAGIPPDSVYRTNVVKHFRFSGTRGKQRIHKSPSRVHVAACEPWLLAELDGVGEVRGRLIDWPEPRDPAHADRVAEEAARPSWVLPTTHPSAVLRSRNRQEDYEALVGDLEVARQALADG